MNGSGINLLRVWMNLIPISPGIARSMLLRQKTNFLSIDLKDLFEMTIVGFMRTNCCHPGGIF